jgi:hypothetical protein
MTPLKEPSNGFAVGFIPSIHSAQFAQVFSLIYLHMAHIAQSRNTVVVGFDAHSLAVTLLI